MSESKSELISSLVDNYFQNENAKNNSSDVQFDEVIDQLAKENGQPSQLVDTWRHYHLIGDTIRDELPARINLDLSAQISAEIDKEPTILAPTSAKTPSTLMTKLTSNVIQLLKPFGQVAIAASAAGLMILGVQQNASNNETVMPSQVAATIPLAGVADPVSFNYQSNDRLTKKQAFIAQQRRFQALLLDHQQQIKLHTSSEHDASEAAFNGVVDNAEVKKDNDDVK